MARIYTPLISVMAAEDGNTVGNTIEVIDFKNISVELSTTGSYNGTIKFQGSQSDTAPTFSSAASGTNHWTFLSFVDQATGSVTAGATGIVPGGTDVIVNLVMNVDDFRHFNIVTSGRSAGSVTAKVRMSDNS